MPSPLKTPGVYIQEDAPGSQVILGAPTSIAAFLGRVASQALPGPQTITSFSDFQQLYGGLSHDFPLSFAVADFFDNGGQQAVVVPVVAPNNGPLAPLLPGDPVQRTGLYQLDGVAAFNILCVPPDDPTRPDGGIPLTFWAQAATYCAGRRAMLLIDPPQAWTDHARSNGFDQIQSSDLGIAGDIARNTAVFFPRPALADPLNGGEVSPRSATGSIAGVWATTDLAHGVWKAPAGTQSALAGATGTEVLLTDAQNAVLNSLAINCIRTFTGIGTVLWGARTLAGADQSADEFKYIPVRRLALFIEESLVQGLRWVIFEPNDESLWSQIRLAVGTFLTGLYRESALMGDTSESAFFVRCDASTTTPQDIANGVVNLAVGFAPVLPAEFVVLTLTLLAAGGVSSQARSGQSRVDAQGNAP